MADHHPVREAALGNRRPAPEREQKTKLTLVCDASSEGNVTPLVRSTPDHAGDRPRALQGAVHGSAHMEGGSFHGVSTCGSVARRFRTRR